MRPGLADLLAYRAGRLYELLLNKYFVDEIYEALIVQPIVSASNWLWSFFDATVIDGLANGTAGAVGANAGLWRRWQTGNVQHYALSFLVGVLAILGYYAWR